MARSLAARGCRLALSGRRNEPLRRLAAEIGQPNAAFPCDVRSAADVEACRAVVEEAVGPIDLAVAAAGVARVGRLTELTAAEIEETIDVNLLGAIHLFGSVLPGMIGRGGGVLVPLLSVAARKGFAEWSAYCASKAGLLGFVEALREEVKGSGVRIVALTPGATATPLWNGVAGEWPRDRMIPVDEVARALIWALEAGDNVAVEEIRLQPPGGDL